MADSFRIHEEVTSGKVRRAAIVGAGHIGLEMADALTGRGLQVELIGRSRSLLPTVDREIGEQIHGRLEEHAARVCSGIEVQQFRGARKVNRRMETTLRDVYAAGDYVETWHRLLQRHSYLPLGATTHK
jgi:pyruvate/2-oxoglutarate dehydrogenase complex dihydrolipoamide dehydrogenase (E3) component